MVDPTRRGESDSTLDAIVASARQQAFGKSGLSMSGSGRERWPGTEPVPERIGQFHIQQFIACGGSSWVFEAMQQHPPRRVAVKILRDCVSKEAMRRFEYEGRLLAKLTHPNIVRIYEVGQWHAAATVRPFLAMEYIGSQTLSNYADKQRLNYRQRLRLLIAVCAGVQHAHRHGIIHRDLKPTNIGVDASGCPKVLDFGVAKAVSDETTMHTKTGQWLGTPLYMSPEQLTHDADSIDTRSDVYGLGAIAYELLSGEPPFQSNGRPIARVVNEICEQPPPRLGAVNPLYRGDVETIVATALQKRPEDRYESASKLATDLQNYLESKPIAARRIGPRGRLTRWSRRQPAAAIASLAAATLAVVLVAGLIVSNWNAKAMAEQRRNQLYAMNMNLAMQAFYDQNFDVARRLLVQQEPSGNETDLRGFAWFHLWHELHQHDRELETHLSSIYDIEFTPDGKRAISCGEGGWCLWDTSSWTLLKKHVQPGMTFSSALFVPDRNVFLTGRYNHHAPAGERYLTHRVSEWDLTSGKLLRESPPVQQQINSIALSLDAEQIFVGGGSLDRNVDTAHLGALSVLSAKTLEQTDCPVTTLAEQNADGVWESGINAIGSVVAVSHRQICTSHKNAPARIWELATGHSRPIAEEAAQSTFLDLSPDKRLLAIGNWNEQIVLWDTVHRKTIRTIQQARPHQVRFSPDGSVLCATGNTHDNGIYLWDVGTGELIDSLTGHSRDVWSLAFHPDGSKLLSGSEDFSLFVWDTSAPAAPQTYVSGEGEVPRLDVSRDQKWLAMGSRNGTARLCDVATKETIFESTRPLSHVWGVAIRPGHEEVAFGFADVPGTGRFDHPIVLFDWTTGEPVIELPDVSGPCGELVFSPDGRLLATTYLYHEAPDCYTLQVWDTATWRTWKVKNAERCAVNALSFSPDSRRIATCGDDCRVRIWDAAPGSKLLKSVRLPAPVVSVRYSPAGDQLAVGTWARNEFATADTEIRLLDANTLETQQILLGHIGGAYGLAFSNDEKVLATGAGGGLVKLWDLRTHMELATLRTPGTGWVFGLKFSRDDRSLFATYGSLTGQCGIVRFDAVSKREAEAHP